MTSSSLAQLWSSYNHKESFLPFYLPLIVWVSTYFYSRYKCFEYHRWYALHNFHNFGAIILGLISIWSNDDTVFNERVGILWSVGYFIVDTVDCLWRLDETYLIHAVLCLALGLANYNLPISRKLRMNSKATFCELSNPLMHLAKKTRNPIHFALFALVYTLCRVIWIPIMMRQLLANDMQASHPVFLCLFVFYLLNLFWYYKILRILWDGATGRGSQRKRKDE